jgi:hypothetical protein
MTEKMLTIGSRAQVWHRTAKKTSGGLTRNHLMMNKSGRIVSKAKHNTAKKENRLLKHGYGTKKGKFGFVKVGSRKNRKGMKGGVTQLGGSGMGELNPADANGSYMIKDVHAQAETPLTRALVGGRRRRKMRGGSAYGSGLYPADANGSYMIKDVVPQKFSPLDRALVGGKRGRKMRGGTGKYIPLTPMELDSNDVQFRAGLGN